VDTVFLLQTFLVIANRLSTVMEADKIVVLENGQLLEEGTHFELYENQGKYFQMWQKQMLPVFSEV
jgi:ABC-type transport system involved in Fe-S cluster assembly fused permease/ATPase subunit